MGPDIICLASLKEELTRKQTHTEGGTCKDQRKMAIYNSAREAPRGNQP